MSASDVFKVDHEQKQRSIEIESAQREYWKCYSKLISRGVVYPPDDWRRDIHNPVYKTLPTLFRLRSIIGWVAIFLLGRSLFLAFC